MSLTVIQESTQCILPKIATCADIDFESCSKEYYSSATSSTIHVLRTSLALALIGFRCGGCFFCSLVTRSACIVIFYEFHTIRKPLCQCIIPSPKAHPRRL